MNDFKIYNYIGNTFNINNDVMQELISFCGEINLTTDEENKKRKIGWYEVSASISFNSKTFTSSTYPFIKQIQPDKYILIVNIYYCEICKSFFHRNTYKTHLRSLFHKRFEQTFTYYNNNTYDKCNEILLDCVQLRKLKSNYIINQKIEKLNISKI